MITQKNKYALYITFFFLIFIFKLYITYSYNSRFINLFWYLSLIRSWYYLIYLIVLLILFLYYNTNKNMNYSYYLLIIYSLFVFWGPYLISGYVRYQDTITVIDYSMDLNNILENEYNSLAKDFPASYIFYNVVFNVVSLKLHMFANFIFIPVFISYIVIFLSVLFNKNFNGSDLYLTCLIPLLIFEYSLTPNTYGFMLFLLIFYVIHTKKKHILLYLSSTTLLFTHLINFYLCFLYILLTSFFRVIFNNKFSIRRSFNALYLLTITPIYYLYYLKRHNYIKLVATILLSNNKSIQDFSINLSQNYLYDKIILIKFSLIFVFTIYFIYYVYRYKNVWILIKKTYVIILYLFLILVSSYFIFYIKGSIQIISRFINPFVLLYGLIFSYFYKYIFNNKLNRFLLIVLIIIINLISPFSCFSRESYINFPVSFMYGHKYYDQFTVCLDATYLNSIGKESYKRLNSMPLLPLNNTNKYYDNGWTRIHNYDWVSKWKYG